MNKRITFARRNPGGKLYGLDMVIALLPIVAMSVMQSGLRGIMLMFAGGATAFVIDSLLNLLIGSRRINPFSFLYGIILACVCPLSVPVWFVTAGAAAAVCICNLLKIYLKFDYINPAALGWLIMIAAAPKIMGIFPSTDSLSTMPIFATPTGFDETQSILMQIRTGFMPGYSAGQLLLGNTIGGVGSAALAAVIIAAVYLIIRRSLVWEIAVSMSACVLLLTAAFIRLPASLFLIYLMQLSAGSFLFAAVFMAADYHAPKTRVLRFAEGIICGAVIMLLRVFNFDEFSVPFALVLCRIISGVADKRLFVRIRQKSLGSKSAVQAE